MSAAGNLLWIVFGGFVCALVWWVSALIMFCSVVGIPWAWAAMVMGTFSLLPFGNEVISRRTLTRRKDLGTGGFGLLGNIVWFIFGGFWLALCHAFCGISWCCTIIGIPFGVQHFKLAGLALAPIGKTIVPKHVGSEVRRRDAEEYVTRARRSYRRDDNYDDDEDDRPRRKGGEGISISMTNARPHLAS